MRPVHWPNTPAPRGFGSQHDERTRRAGDRRVRQAAADDWLRVLDGLLTQMVEQQERQLLQLARQMVPDLTPEDLRNPQDFAALGRDPEFNYEDGLLAGLRAAHMAIRAELKAAR